MPVGAHFKPMDGRTGFGLRHQNSGAARKRNKGNNDLFHSVA